MQRGRPVLRFAGKVLNQSATAVLATLIGGYVLTFLDVRSAFNVRPADPPQATNVPAAQDQRALTREYVKAMHEGTANSDIAEVHPVPTPAPAPPRDPVATRPAAREVSPRQALAARKDSKLRAEPALTASVAGAGSSPSSPPYVPEPFVPKADPLPVAVQADMVPAVPQPNASPVAQSGATSPGTQTNTIATAAQQPTLAQPNISRANAGATGTPPLAAAASSPQPAGTIAPALGEPIKLVPSAVAAAEQDAAPAPAASPAAVPAQPGNNKVFSTISTALGNAANATGEGINFVFDLPGRALGIGRDSQRASTPARDDTRPAPGDASPRPMQYTGS